MNQKIFKLFANCIPVKGAKRCIIADIQRSDFYLIPQGLFEILTEHKNKSIQEICAYYNNEIDDTIQKLLNSLEHDELGFWCDNPENFPNLSLEWKSSSIISNAIIEINHISHDFMKIFSGLSDLNCKFIELRFYKKLNIQEIELIIKESQETVFRNIDILVEFSDDCLNFDFDDFFKTYQRIGRFIIYNANEEKVISEINSQAFFTKQDLSSNLHCGQIHQHYFIINNPTFTESQHHNTCLNRKISIDQNGNIKNCPSMTESYGNIANTTLQEALNHPDFKKYWNITKDKISVCKDCEFRHICTDCRAYIENPEDILSKPLKCLSRNLGGGYNPYTCEWEEWSTNPLKEKAKKHYGMTTM